MKWNDIRDRLKKSTNTVMESLQSPSPVSPGIVSPNSSVDTKKTLARKVFFPVIVAAVIIAGVLVVYFVFKNKNVPTDDESFTLDRAEVSAVNNFFTENPAQPVTNTDMQQVQNILNPQPEPSVATPSAKPAVKK